MCGDKYIRLFFEEFYQIGYRRFRNAQDAYFKYVNFFCKFTILTFMDEIVNKY